MNMKILLIISALLFAVCFSEQILGGDVELDFGSAKTMTQIKFKFQLKTKLDFQDYLKVVFPFPLQNLVTATSFAPLGTQLVKPKNLEGYWYQLADDMNLIDPLPSPIQILSPAVDSSTYYLKFLQRNQTIYEINLLWHIIQFNVRDSDALQYQISNNILIIKMFAQSSTDTNAIIYDENQIQNYFFLQDLPLQSIHLSTKFLTLNKAYQINAINTLYLDTFVTGSDDQFDELIRFYYIISDPNFQFDATSTCFSATKYDLPKISIYSQNDLTCKIDLSNTQIMLVTVKKNEFMKQKAIRIAAKIKNANKVINSADITVRMLRQYSPQIVQYGKAVDILKTQGIQIIYNEIFLAWGIRPDPNLPLNMQIVRGDSPTATYHPYNSFKVKFQLLEDTPVGVELKLDLKINAEADAILLIGSLSENLSDALNKKVTCLQIFAKSVTQRKITCYGVGQLFASTQYHISFKMYFPYDILTSNVYTSNYGSISIQTAQKIQPQDSLFVFGRGKDFLEYMNSKSDSTLIKEDTTNFLVYLRSFDQIYLLARGIDFQDYDQEIYVNNRPSNYANSFDGTQKQQNFDDTFMPAVNLDFLIYVDKYRKDLYIFQRQVNSNMDYIKNYDTQPLVSLSTPTNLVFFKSINGKNWMPNTNNYYPSMVSSSPTINDLTDPFNFVTGSTSINNPHSYSTGLQNSLYPQRLVFTLNVGYADITQYSSNSGFTFSNSVGFMILMNNQIKPIDSFYGQQFEGINPQPQSMTVTRGTTTDASAYNQYSFIKIGLSSSDGLAAMFPYSLNTGYNIWSIKPFNFQVFSSNLVDNNLLDFYIASIDNIDGSLSNQVINSYVLINAATIDSSLFQNLKVSITNYWSKSDGTEGIDGRYLPVILKIQGKLTAQEATNIQKLAVFFDNMVAFYTNPFQNSISCQSTNLANGSLNIQPQSCKFYQSFDIYQSSILIQSRVEFILTDYQSEFTILIPVKVQGVLNPNKLTINLQVASFQVHPDYSSSSKSYYQIMGINSRVAQSFISDVSSTNSLLANFFSINFNAYTGIAYGIDLTGQPCETTAGQSCINNLISTAVNLRAAHSGGGSQIIDNNVDATKVSSGFTYVADYQFYQTSSVLAWDLMGSNLADTCLFFDYLYFYVDKLLGGTNHALQNKYAVFCPNNANPGTVGSTTKLTITNLKLPYNSGKTILGYGGWSQNDGNLMTLQSNTYIIQKSISLSSLILPQIAPQMQQGTISWRFQNPVPISSQIYVSVSTVSGIFNFDSTSQVSCQLFVYNPNILTDPNLDPESYSLSHQCAIDYNSVNKNLIIYKIENIRGSYPINTNLEIQHYGIISQSSGSNINVDIKFYSLYFGILANYIVFDCLNSVTPQIILFNNTIPISAQTLSNFTIQTLNLQAKSSFSFIATMQGRYMQKREVLVFDFNKYVSLNTPIRESLKCKIYNIDNTISHIWKSLDLSVLSQVKLISNNFIFRAKTQIIFSCQGFINPADNTAGQLSFNIQTSQSINIFTNPFTLAFPTFTALRTSGQSIEIIKSYDFPTSKVDMIFKLNTMTMILNSFSRILIMFPIYYIPQLSKDNVLDCYIGILEKQQIQCGVKQDRLLEIKYFSTSISDNVVFELIVSGVSQPFVQTSGKQFYFAFDDDIDDLDVRETIYLTESIPTNYEKTALAGVVELRSVILNSIFLRDSQVQYIFQIYLPTTNSPLLFGQSIQINFPPKYSDSLRQQRTLDCSIMRFDDFDKQYGGSCLVSDLRVKIVINEQMEQGFLYNITINNLRNLDFYEPSIYKWFIDVFDTDQKTLVLRSFASTSNFQMIQFEKGYNGNFLDLQFANGSSARQMNLISGVYSDWIYIVRESGEQVFGQSFNLRSTNNFINLDPSTLEVNVGTTGYKFRVYSQLALGITSLQLQKKGGADYYSNLPTLQIQFDNNFLNLFSFKEELPNIFKVYKSATTFSIFLNLNCNPPVSFISANFTLPTGTGLEFLNNISYLQLNNSQNAGFVNFNVKFTGLFVDGSQILIPYTLSGDNVKQYYQTATPSIQINVISDPTDLKNTALLQQVSVTQNTYQINVQCSLYGRIFYTYNRRYEDDNQCLRSATDIYSKTSNSSYIINENSLYDCQSQYGFQNYLQLGSFNQISVSDLLAKQNYRFSAVCLNIKDNLLGEVQHLNFSTMDNSGLHVKIKFDFLDQLPTLDQQSQLACLLALNFKTTFDSVTTMNYVTCVNINFDKRRRQLYEINNLQQSKRRILSQIQISCTSQTEIQTRNQTNIYSMTYYIGRNQHINSDQNFLQVLSQTKCSGFKNYIQNNIAVLPTIYNIYPGIQINDVAPTQDPNFVPQIYFGYSWVHLRNIKLNNDGVIYLILANIEDKAPNHIQLRNGLVGSDSKALKFKKIIFDSSLNVQYNLTFTNINNGKAYKIYYFYSNEIPFDYMTMSNIYNQIFITPFIPVNLNQLQLSHAIFYSILIIMIVFA